MAFVTTHRFALIWIITTCALFTHARAQQASGEQAAPTIREVEITVLPGRLMFSRRAVMARPGERLRFKVKNTGGLPHNFVICCEGGGTWKDVAEAVIDLGGHALSQAFNPGPPLVMHATPLLRPGDEAVLEWRAPARKGAYPFLSSVPGHASLMRGEVIVSPVTSDLTATDDYVIAPAEDRPVAVSVPMPDAAALALAVSVPRQLNYCFDPETLSVRYAWTGGFLDAAPAPDDGSGRPGGNCRPLGKIMSLGGGSGFPLRIGELSGEAPEARYLGHTSGSAEKAPELMFQVGDYTVAQKVTLHERGERPIVEYTFRFDPAPAPGVPILFHANPQRVEVTAKQGFARDGIAVITLPAGEQSLTVRLQPKTSE